MSTSKEKFIGVTFAALLFGSPVLADDTCKLGGMWRLVSFHSEDIVTKSRFHTYGERPWGYLTIGCDGQFSAWVESRQSAKTLTASKNDPLHRAIFYSGQYRVTANTIVTRIAEARHEGWIAYDAGDTTWTEWQSQTDDPRSFRVVINDLGNAILLIETAPMSNPNGYGNRTVGRTVWERVENWEFALPY